MYRPRLQRRHRKIRRVCVKVIGMRYIATIIGLILSGGSYGALAADLTVYKKTCSEIGFKAGSEKHGVCVLKFYERSKKNHQKRNYQVQQSRIEQQQREILARQQRIEELNEQRLAEAQRMAKEADAQRRINSVDKIFRGLSMMGGGQSSPSYRSGGGSNLTGFLKSQYVSGMNRICTYNAAGSDKTLTVGAATICPLQY